MLVSKIAQICVTPHTNANICVTLTIMLFSCVETQCRYKAPRTLGDCEGPVVNSLYSNRRYLVAFVKATHKILHLEYFK